MPKNDETPGFALAGDPGGRQLKPVPFVRKIRSGSPNERALSPEGDYVVVSEHTALSM